MNVIAKPKLAFWKDAEELECVSFLPEAPGVTTFCFQAPSGALFSFDPGQFLTVELPVRGGPIYRTYTIGICGSCKIRKTRGEVHMVHNGGITDEDVARGYILACCSNPIGRVSVEA